MTVLGTDSSLHLPRGGAVFVVFDGNAHACEFVADAVRFFPVFVVTGEKAIFDEADNGFSANQRCWIVSQALQCYSSLRYA